MFGQLTPVVKNLLLILLGIFILQSVSPMVEVYGKLYDFRSDYFKPFQIFTHMFMHGDLGHLFSNGLPLFFLGPMLERTMGEKRFLLLFLICGVGAGALFDLAQFITISDQDIHSLDQIIRQYLQAGETRVGGMLGASGAVFGVLMAAAMYFPNAQIIIFPIPIPIKIKYFVLVYGLIEFYSVYKPHEGDNVAHLAHLAGLAIAFVLIKFWNKRGYNGY